MEPRLRKAYVVGAALGLTAGALMAWFVLRPILDFIHPVDEEERPPVVVSNGSVILEVPDVSRDSGQKPIPPAKKGKFNKEDQTVYRHAGKNPGNDKSVAYFELWIGGASTCTTPLTDLKSLTIVTTNGEIKISIRPRVGVGNQKKDLWYEFPAGVVAPVDHRLELGDPHKLQAVVYQPSTTTPAAIPPATTCTFDAPDPKTHWLQIWAR